MKTLGNEKAMQYGRSYDDKISRPVSQVLYLVDDRTSGSIALSPSLTALNNNRQSFIATDQYFSPLNPKTLLSLISANT